jgi:MarR family transcriptional regulator, transcriptional regulator for hemolysin
VELPIGRAIAMTSKRLQRSFSDALGDAGGTFPAWQVLLAVQRQGARTQQDLARAIGVEGPTLTRQLDALEAAGLVVRQRDLHDRRAIRVKATPRGQAQFRRLAKAAGDFDERLRSGLSDQEIAQLRDLLARISANAVRANSEKER